MWSPTRIGDFVDNPHEFATLGIELWVVLSVRQAEAVRRPNDVDVLVKTECVDAPRHIAKGPHARSPRFDPSHEWGAPTISLGPSAASEVGKYGVS